MYLCLYNANTKNFINYIHINKSFALFFPQYYQNISTMSTIIVQFLFFLFGSAFNIRIVRNAYDL